MAMLSNDAAAPVDRPNLSKDHHAGSAREEWLPLRADSFYAEAEIELRLNTDVNSLSARACPTDPEWTADRARNRPKLIYSEPPRA